MYKPTKWRNEAPIVPVAPKAVSGTGKVVISDGGSVIGTWQFGDKSFQGGRTGYFVNGAINVALQAPRVTVIIDGLEVVSDLPLPAREFKPNAKGQVHVGYYFGGNDSMIGTEQGLFCFSVQILTAQDKKSWQNIPNRHRFQVMAYSV